jgi:hypothetical protein
MLLSSNNTPKFVTYYKDGQLIGRYTLAESIHAANIISKRYKTLPFMLASMGITKVNEY